MIENLESISPSEVKQGSIMRKYLSIYQSRFFYLLCLLILYTMGVTLVEDNQEIRIALGGLFTILILFCFYIIPHKKFILSFTIITGIMSITLHWLIFLYRPGNYLNLSFCLSNIFFLFSITFITLYAVTKSKEITIDTLCGAISGYLMIGFFWGFIYLLIDMMNPTAFSPSILHHTIHDNIQHFFYFSFTTMTTLGYGDILPLSNLARTCSWLEAIIGQIYLAVWVSQLVALRISQKNVMH